MPQPLHDHRLKEAELACTVIDASIKLTAFESADPDNPRNFPIAHEERLGFLHCVSEQYSGILCRVRSDFQNNLRTLEDYKSYLILFQKVLSDDRLYTLPSLRRDEIQDEIRKYLRD